MVNVAAFIRRKKEQFQQARTRRGQEDNLRRADELQRLRTERIQTEGKAKLETLRQEEVRRISEAKAKTPSKLKSFAMGLQKATNSFKSSRPGKTTGRKTKRLYSRESNRGSTGLDLSPRNSSPFNFGGK